MKFCIMTHIRYPEHNSCSESQIYTNSRWWTLPFKKIVKWDISAIVSLILIKFGTRITPTSIPGDCIHKGMRTQKVSITFYIWPQTVQKVQMSVCMPNAWNIQTFTISLLLFDQFWWNFAWQSIFVFPSWWVTKSLRILKSKLTDGGQLENSEKFQFSSILYPKTAKKSK